MARLRKYSDQQLEIFAYTIYRNTHRWPTIQDFRKTYECSYERAERAITEAQMTASGAIEATLFEALAIYAGFSSSWTALLALETWRKTPDLKTMKKPELRAAVVMICPHKYLRRATADELRKILRNAGVKDTPEENLNERRLQVQKLYGEWPIAGKQPGHVGEEFAKWTAQEYVSERNRRHIKNIGKWDNLPERYEDMQAAQEREANFWEGLEEPKSFFSLHLAAGTGEEGGWRWGVESDRKYWWEEWERGISETHNPPEGESSDLN